MAQYHSFADFKGSFTGSYDGRNATLTIASASGYSFNTIYDLTFRDLDRDETYQGQVLFPEGTPSTWVLTDITLERVGGSGQIFWSRLYLHTWDIAFMSGVSVWQGKEFGMSFRRS